MRRRRSSAGGPSRRAGDGPPPSRRGRRGRSASSRRRWRCSTGRSRSPPTPSRTRPCGRVRSARRPAVPAPRGQPHVEAVAAHRLREQERAEEQEDDGVRVGREHLPRRRHPGRYRQRGSDERRRRKRDRLRDPPRNGESEDAEEPSCLRRVIPGSTGKRRRRARVPPGARPSSGRARAAPRGPRGAWGATLCPRRRERPRGVRPGRVLSTRRVWSSFCSPRRNAGPHRTRHRPARAAAPPERRRRCRGDARRRTPDRPRPWPRWCRRCTPPAGWPGWRTTSPTSQAHGSTRPITMAVGCSRSTGPSARKSNGGLWPQLTKRSRPLASS